MNQHSDTQMKINTKYQHDIHYTSAQLMMTLRLLERRLGYFNTLVALKRILKQRK